MLYNLVDMCGISGITENNIELVKKMVSITKHRGPDDIGFFSDDEITLGHSRLSIQDTTSAGHQPMKSSSGRYAIVFNGEIYNFKKLRPELESGHKFISGSDTEVILEMFEKYGIDSLKELSGIYALGIWDRDKKELILSRDPAGVKPLYYASINNKLVFSSEIKSIYSLLPKKEINLRSLNCYFKLGYVTGEDTIWQGIRRVMPGSAIIISNGAINKIKIDKSLNTPEINNLKDAHDSIPVLLKEVVKDQMISDVPVGLYLSGGIDSNLLLSLMSEISTKKINTYSSMFRVSNDNEEKFNSDAINAKKSAKFFEANHHEVHVSEKSIIDYIEDVVWHMDEPNANSSLIPNFLLAKEASNNNKVILSGEGGDEIFGGYNRYKSYRFIENWRKAPSILRKTLLPLVPNYFLSKKNKSRLNFTNLTDLYLSFAENNEINSKKILLSGIQNDDELHNYLNAFLSKFFNSSSIFDSLINAELNSWLVDDYLMRADKVNMAHGVENRVPFLDERLISLSKTLKSSWKYPLSNSVRGKEVLINSMNEYIPEFILNSPKKGWVTPISKWLREGLKDLAYTITDKNFTSGTEQYINFKEVNKILDQHINGQVYGVQNIWSVITFQLWYKKFISE